MENGDAVKVTVSAETLYNVGVLYLEGRAVKQDLKEARKHFENAAAQNHVPSIQKLAELFENRASGVAGASLQTKPALLGQLRAGLEGQKNFAKTFTCEDIKRQLGLI